MSFQKPSTRAFTLTELMIVIILVGLIAGFGIPNYEKAMDRAKERDALSNLTTIRDAVKLYMSRNGDAAPPDLTDVAAINDGLNLNIIEQQHNRYTCSASSIYSCRATNSSTGWQLGFDLNSNGGAIFCSGGTCPLTP